jgi:hypothetical protein
MPEMMVNGIVAARDKQPYIQLSTEKGLICQMTMGEARKFAGDIEFMASRTEADAMLVKFFSGNEFPEQAAGALLTDFREFRHKLDMEKVEGSVSEPQALTPAKCPTCTAEFSVHGLNAIMFCPNCGVKLEAGF